MITEKHLFVTTDGSQFETHHEAELYELYEEIKDAMNEGLYEDEFHVEDALTGLLSRFKITRNEKEND